MAARTEDPLDRAGSTDLTPREVLDAQRLVEHKASSAEIAGLRKSTAPRPDVKAAEVYERAKKDFRVFLTLVWRHLLGVDPSPIQLDMAWWLQHGPDRAIIMAFRGFSKSWITGAYALWRLLNDPDEKILVVSGSLTRAVATTQWCLALINTMPILRGLRPKPSNRQSGQMFDVGNCVPAQSASFMAMGISGQLVGFRGTCIIPDDVETQTNSETVLMRDKNRERVKEFESVLVPGGVIKYLGTPHDVDSLYLYLLRLKAEDGSPVYMGRIWPSRFPTRAEVKTYGPWLAPYIEAEIIKLGPSCIGHSTMPNRFTDADLAKREAAMGKNEFRLQFMLDLTGTLQDKFPLRFRNLIVMPLDDTTGPEEVTWGTGEMVKNIQSMGHDGDFFYKPAFAGERRSPWQKVVAFLDPSGVGKDESSLSVLAYLFGRLFALHQVNSKDGFTPAFLKAVAVACVRFGVHELHYETNGVGATFGALLGPYLSAAWSAHNKAVRSVDRMAVPGGTALVAVKSTVQGKEARILGILEPITQQHRLVVSEQLLRDDYDSIQQMDGEDGRRYYSLAYQYSHLANERDCLIHDDRLDSLAGACGIFAEMLGVDPTGLASQAAEDRLEDELEALFAETDEVAGYGHRKPSQRPLGTLPTKR